MYPGQGGPSQPPWQQPSFHQARHSGPPPPKRARSGPGPVITRYPPPPGYQGPAKPPVPFQQQGWPQQQKHGYAQPGAYSGYHSQSYGSNPQYQQQQYPGYHPATGQPYTGTGYNQQNYYQAQAQGYSQPSGASPWQPNPYMPLATQQQGPTPPWQPSQPAAQQASTQPWHQQNGFHQQRRHNSSPFPVPPPDAFNQSSSQQPAPTHVSNEAEELEGNYWDECYFSTHANEIDTNLSLGEIIYHPALPTRRPLPATFDLAELEAIAPRVPQPTDDESISDYHINSRKHEHQIDIRQTDMWEHLKDDPIFREFPRISADLLQTAKIRPLWADRSDPRWLTFNGSPNPEPEQEQPEQEDTADTKSGAAEIDNQSPASHAVQDEQDDVLGNLERAVEQNRNSRTGYRSRTNSIASNASHASQTRPQPMGLVRDKAQEDLLAQLGVTGSPKMVYGLPPAVVPQRHNSATSNSNRRDASGEIKPGRRTSQPSIPPPNQTNGSTGTYSRSNSTTNHHGSRPLPPPPPPPPPPMDQWSQQGPTSVDSGVWNGFWAQSNGHNHSRRGSNTSQNTATGSDFHEDAETTLPGLKGNEATPRAAKRGFEDEDDGEETPKPRKMARAEGW